MSLLVFILIGVATVYNGPVNNPLFCDVDGSLRYNDHTPPWVALNVTLYNGWADCGDEIYLSGYSEYGERWELTALALDAGPLHLYYVEDFGSSSPIVVDIPAIHSPFSGLSSRVQAINVTRAEKFLEGMVIE